MEEIGIWKYSQYFTPNVSEEFRLTLGEGDTPCEAYKDFARGHNLETFFLKREDQNPNGSHKDRSLAYWISALIQRGEGEFVISSSGNAAISAAAYSKLANANLHIFLSPKVSKSKLKRLSEAMDQDVSDWSENLQGGESMSTDNFFLHVAKRSKTEAFRFAQEFGGILLRGSTDDRALEGLKTIALELVEQSPNADSIFIPCSSGTAVMGIYKGFNEFVKGLPEDSEVTMPQIHIVQTTKVNAIAREFDKDFKQSEKSEAKAIVDKVAHRKGEVVAAVKESGGSGWVVSDREIEEGLKLLKDLGVECSAEGGMTVAAMLKAKKKKWGFARPVCLITGAK